MRSGCSITEALNQAVDESPGVKVLVNLASNEYFGSVIPDSLAAPIITPVFLDEKNGKYKVISFFAKKARGSMAGWLIRNRIKTIKGIREWDEMGYRFDDDRSSADTPVFIRPRARAEGCYQLLRLRGPGVARFHQRPLNRQRPLADEALSAAC